MSINKQQLLLAAFSTIRSNTHQLKTSFGRTNQRCVEETTPHRITVSVLVLCALLKTVHLFFLCRESRIERNVTHILQRKTLMAFKLPN